jgi:hypothetical protein
MWFVIRSPAHSDFLQMGMRLGPLRISLSFVHLARLEEIGAQQGA